MDDVDDLYEDAMDRLAQPISTGGFEGEDDPCGDCSCCRHHFCPGEDCGEMCPCSAG
jgi:hypothetical protein